MRITDASSRKVVTNFSQTEVVNLTDEIRTLRRTEIYDYLRSILAV
jgi:hypothetical protein